jgi:hypothetical protein
MEPLKNGVGSSGIVRDSDILEFSLADLIKKKETILSTYNWIVLRQSFGC